MEDGSGYSIWIIDFATLVRFVRYLHSCCATYIWTLVVKENGHGQCNIKIFVTCLLLRLCVQ